jgi:hypothetical protein
MRKFIMVATTLTAFGAMMATAHADVINGGPVKNGNQCFKYSGLSKDSRFGYWAACPETASTSTATTPRRSTRRSRSASH